MLSSWILYILLGRLMLFLWMQFPLPQRLEEIRTINKLHKCLLCAGVWVYTILALCFRLNILAGLGLPYVLVIGEIVTGGAISFVMFIFEIGWKDYFTPEIRI